MITIELTDKQAIAFRAWERVNEQFNTMLHSGVFDVKNGYAQIHFDKDGNIGAIERHEAVYRR